MSTSAEDADAEFHNSAEYLGALKILENAIRSRRLRRLWPDMEKLQSRYMDQAALAAGAGSNPLYSNFALAVREGLRFAPEVQQALSHAWLVCTSAAGTTAAPSGTRWTNAGTKQPPHAVQLTNPSLESALGQGHLDFTSAQLQNFGVPPLRPDHYVKAGEAYFMPAATLPRDDYEAMTRKLYLAIMLDDEDVGVDPLDCAATRDNDWAEDSEGKEELTEAAFHKAWFQVRRPAHTAPRPRRAPSAPCPARAVGLPSVWLQRTGTAGAGRCMHCACACERAYAYAPVRAPVRAPVACAAAATGSRRIALAPFLPSCLPASRVKDSPLPRRVQLADMNTDALGAQEYASWISRMVTAITKPDGSSGAAMRVNGRSVAVPSTWQSDSALLEELRAAGRVPKASTVCSANDLAPSLWHRQTSLSSGRVPTGWAGCFRSSTTVHSSNGRSKRSAPPMARSSRMSTTTLSSRAPGTRPPSMASTTKARTD